LLEHELRNEDGVGIASAAPWEIAALFSIPAKEGATKRGGVRKRIHGDGENV
jgi:hypothetical protein